VSCNHYNNHLEDSSTIILARSRCSGRQTYIVSLRSTIIRECLPFSPSPALLQRRGEDNSYNNRLRPPKAVTIVVTSCLAYSSTIFIGLDSYSSEPLLSIYSKTNRSKIWLTASSSVQQHKKTRKQIQQVVRAKFVKASNAIELIYDNGRGCGCKGKHHLFQHFPKLYIVLCKKTLDYA
jgi:hypothetical protein